MISALGILIDRDGRKPVPPPPSLFCHSSPSSSEGSVVLAGGKIDKVYREMRKISTNQNQTSVWI